MSALCIKKDRPYAPSANTIVNTYDRAIKHVLLFVVLLMTSCGQTGAAKTAQYVITSAALSADAEKIAMTIRPLDGNIARVAIYDIRSESFQAVPSIMDGWIPSDPALSGDNSQVVVEAQCPTCENENDRSRIMIADLQKRSWRTVVSGPGYRTGPTFIQGTRKILFIQGELASGARGRPLFLRPTPATADIDTHEVRLLSFGKIWFLHIFNPYLGPGPAIYFTGISPKDPDLQEQIRRQKKSKGKYATLLYRLPIDSVTSTSAFEGRPELVDYVNSIPGAGDISEANSSFDASRVVFLSARAEHNRLIEELYLVEDKQGKLVLSTEINIHRLSLSADGRTALILGDPTRSRGKSINLDLFLVDVASGSLKPLRVGHRIQGSIKHSEK